ncbi:hypothetical protein E4U42_004966 [Claviceps africana]|uniref:Uncharacterized protein n=1 Tax=Claviceps africana TaxID=83212 RepID=A0A8K0NKF1_9HYPO|nr:hypothetical protein E4U42_004966 [Claviceps africana]
MAFYQPCPGLDPSLEHHPSPESFFQTTKAPSPLLYYVDEFGNPFPIAPPAMYPDPSLPCHDALLATPPPPCLLPVLDLQFLPWPASESFSVDPWTMEAISPASPASDTPDLEYHHAPLPTSISPSSPPTRPPQPRTRTANDTPSASFPVSSPAVGPDRHHPREHPSLPPPPPPRPPADDTPPYMTPRAIKARELILQCDFPRDQTPPQNPASGTPGRRKRLIPAFLKKKKTLLTGPA